MYRLNMLVVCVLLVTLVSSCSHRDRDVIVSEDISQSGVSSDVLSEDSKIGDDRLRSHEIKHKTTSANAYEIALLLPLTGDHANIGKALRDAAILALKANKSLYVKIYDTASDPEIAVEAAHEAALSGAVAIVGPVYSSVAREVVPVAAQYNIPVFSFTTDTEIAGDDVFVLGYRPSEQIDRIIDFAFSRGIKEYLALLPSTPHGKMIAKQIHNKVRNNEGSIIKTEFYLNDNQSIQIGAKSIFDAIRIAESRQKESMPKGLIMIEGGDTLHKLAHLMDEYSINNYSVRLLGTGQWDENSTIDLPGITGGWFATASPLLHKKFENYFVSQFNYMPPWIASISYDVISLIQILCERSKGGYLNTNLLKYNNKGFAGVDGLFRFNHGVTERKLSIMEVTPAGFIEIDQSESSF